MEFTRVVKLSGWQKWNKVLLAPKFACAQCEVLGRRKGVGRVTD